ncbi:hypothetical protein KAT89_00335 [candidate division WOR-3 bacterium]|nr:hypothetical protein [candidate division WOR-3 bacterium]
MGNFSCFSLLYPIFCHLKRHHCYDYIVRYRGHRERIVNNNYKDQSKKRRHSEKLNKIIKERINCAIADMEQVGDNTIFRGSVAGTKRIFVCNKGFKEWYLLYKTRE